MGKCPLRPLDTYRSLGLDGTSRPPARVQVSPKYDSQSLEGMKKSVIGFGGGRALASSRFALCYWAEPKAPSTGQVRGGKGWAVVEARILTFKSNVIYARLLSTHKTKIQ